MCVAPHCRRAEAVRVPRPGRGEQWRGSVPAAVPDERNARSGRMDIRRVVTGHDKDGKAIVVDDQMVAPVVLTLVPGNEFHRLWGADSVRSFPDDGSKPEAREYFPPLGGFRFGFFTIPPDGGAGAPAGLDIEAALAEFEEQLPGMGRYLD